MKNKDVYYGLMVAITLFIVVIGLFFNNDFANAMKTVVGQTQVSTSGQKVETMKITKTYQDFKLFSVVSNQASEIINLPIGSEVQSVYFVIKYQFLDSNLNQPAFNIYVLNSAGTGECPVSQTNIGGGDNYFIAQQVLAHQVICNFSDTGRIYVQAANTSSNLIQGDMDIYISYITY